MDNINSKSAEQTSIKVESIVKASHKLSKVVTHTPTNRSMILSEKYENNIYLKREDLQIVRSYKLRGAYNHISSYQGQDVIKNGVVCASAGNHAQGVAFACRHLNIKGSIFMPNTTPKQKVKQVQMFGKDNIEVMLNGDTFDDSYKEAIQYSQDHNMLFVPPFDNQKVIEGQGSVGVEILNDVNTEIDYLFIPVGGGGLSAGVGTYFKHVSPNTKIIGVEPEGAPSMTRSLENKKNTTLKEITKFVDGASVKRVGDLNFEICSNVIDEMILVPEGKICSTIIQLYNEEAIVAEPAGAMSVAALDFYKDEIKGKNVVCILSGGNNDIGRMEEIKERSLIYEGLKHYFIIRFPQRAGALREFLDQVLGPTDDITRFEYTKKSSKEEGPALVGIEVKYPEDYYGLIERMKQNKINYTNLYDDPNLFNYFL